MGRRSLFFLGLIFLALLVGYILQQRSLRPASVGEVFRPLLKGLSSSVIDEIVLWQGQNQVVLRKESGRWWLISPLKAPAQPEKVDHLLKAVVTLRGEERVRGREFWANFSLKEDQALHLILRSGGKDVAHILVGRRGPQWSSSFVRLAGEEIVYLVPEDVLGMLEIWNQEPKVPAARVFVDLKVLSPRPETLERLVFAWPEKKVSWSLEKTKDGFVLRQGGQARALTKEEVEGLIRRAFPLYASDLLDKEAAKGCHLTGLLEIQDDRGQETLKFGRLNKKGDLCLEKKGVVYRLAPSALKGLLKP